MPSFVPISTFKAFYASVGDLFTAEGFNEFQERLKSDEVRDFILREGISSEDFGSFLKSIRDPGNILFYDWVESNKGLLNVLERKGFEKAFSDPGGIEKHQYFNSFRIFISPFLADVLLKMSPENEEERRRAMSYLPLLDDDHRLLLEDQYFVPIRDRLRKLEKEAREFTEEQELVDAVKPLCSAEIIAQINALSKASYASKLYYVDTILGTIRTKACTARFANWVLKEMEKVSLNREHEYKISDLRNDLREGRLQVRNEGSRNNPVRKRDIITIGLILVLGGGIFYLLYFQPFNEVKETEFGKSSSFRQFTKEERMRIDSLIQEIKIDVNPEESIIDPGIGTVDYGPTLSIRKESRNELMEQIYDDLSKDARIQLQDADSCTAVEKAFERYPGVQDLKTRSGKVSALFRNNSDYDAIIYVAEDKSGGKVYSVMISSGSQADVKLAPGDMITLVYGNHFAAYKDPKNTGGHSLPSSRLRHHFCDIDVNYEEGINTSYRYADKVRTTVKFMISGSGGYYVQLIDVYDVLEDYGS